MQYLPKARGKYLTAIGLDRGVKRRWWGLEPDFMYRKRIQRLD